MAEYCIIIKDTESGADVKFGAHKDNPNGLLQDKSSTASTIAEKVVMLINEMHEKPNSVQSESSFIQ